MTEVLLLLAQRASQGWEIFLTSLSFYPSEFSGIIFCEDDSGLLWNFLAYYYIEKKLIKLVDRTFHTSRTFSAQATWQEGPWLCLFPSPGNPENSRPRQHPNGHSFFYCTRDLPVSLWHGRESCRYSMLAKKVRVICFHYPFWVLTDHSA